MTDRQTRAEMIEDGELVDYTDVAAEMGYAWPVAITRHLEAAIQATLPPGLQVSDDSPGDIRRQVINEQAMGAALYEVFGQAAQVMQDGAAASVAIANASSITYRHDCAWRDNTKLMIRVAIQDDEGSPCFTLDIAE
jgi:hypothetical protein